MSTLNNLMRNMKEMMSCHMKMEESNEMCIFKDYNRMIKETKENEEMQKSNLITVCTKNKK